MQSGDYLDYKLIYLINLQYNRDNASYKFTAPLGCIYSKATCTGGQLKCSATYTFKDCIHCGSYHKNICFTKHAASVQQCLNE